ncbi:MAG: hypothetical protein H6964_04655 [Chromatiaceae bacterium]|nr:hypothetical protein [Chromatiaceae bacterium]
MTSNTGDTWIKSLLDSLQSLYSKLSFVIIDRRIHSYRKESTVVVDKDILAKLLEMVEQTPARKASGSAVNDAKPAAETNGLTAGVRKTGSDIQQHSAAPEMVYKDLSNHLHKAADSDSLGARLKTSAWDHIHTSMRYLREENPDLAKMHAGLANEALAQAAHHLTDEAYAELKSSIMAELQKLRTH